jgi:hypothetical protein
MISARQMKLMRRNIVQHFDEFHRILSSKMLNRSFGGLAGEEYQRFPKEYNETAASAKYLWHKQFYLGKNFTRKEVIDKKYFARVADELALTIPFFLWVQRTVGTYQKNQISFG